MNLYNSEKILVRDESHATAVIKSWIGESLEGASLKGIEKSESLKSLTVSVGLVRSAVEGLKQRNKFLEYSDFGVAFDSVTAIAQIGVDNDSFRPLRKNGSLDKTVSEHSLSTVDLITKPFVVKIEVGFDEILDLSEVAVKEVLDEKIIKAMEKGMVGKAIYSNKNSVNAHLKEFDGVEATVAEANKFYGIDGDTITATIDPTDILSVLEEVTSVDVVEDYIGNEDDKVLYVGPSTYRKIKSAQKAGSDLIAFDIYNGNVLKYDGIEIVRLQEIGSTINGEKQADLVIYGAKKAVAIRVHGRSYKLKTVEIFEGIEAGGEVKYGAVAGTPEALVVAYLDRAAD